VVSYFGCEIHCSRSGCRTFRRDGRRWTGSVILMRGCGPVDPHVDRKMRRVKFHTSTISRKQQLAQMLPPETYAIRIDVHFVIVGRETSSLRGLNL
jgi:endonuclease III